MLALALYLSGEELLEEACHVIHVAHVSSYSHSHQVGYSGLAQHIHCEPSLGNCAVACTALCLAILTPMLHAQARDSTSGKVLRKLVQKQQEIREHVQHWFLMCTAIPDVLIRARNTMGMFCCNLPPKSST